VLTARGFCLVPAFFRVDWMKQGPQPVFALCATVSANLVVVPSAPDEGGRGRGEGTTTTRVRLGSCRDVVPRYPFYVARGTDGEGGRREAGVIAAAVGLKPIRERIGQSAGK
jgi:hypothetical protein